MESLKNEVKFLKVNLNMFEGAWGPQHNTWNYCWPEFLIAGILGSRIPNMIWEDSELFKSTHLFSRLFLAPKGALYPEKWHTHTDWLTQSLTLSFLWNYMNRSSSWEEQSYSHSHSHLTDISQSSQSTLTLILHWSCSNLTVI